jgi:outer membrane protein assembly factor BamD (BamD/ComL family)
MTTKPRIGSYGLQLALVAFLVFFATLAVQAQGITPGSRGVTTGTGTNTIQGRVMFPPGQTAVQVKVSLEGISSFSSNTTVTDQDGGFRFNGISAGNYTVVVDAGSQYEKGREPITLEPEANARVAQVVVELHFKIDASNPAFAGVPQNALSLYQKGTQAAQKGNTKAAAEFYSQAIAADPTFALALNDLGFMYMKLNQTDKAGEVYEQLVKLKPNEPLPHLNLGIVYFNKKKFEDAQGHLEKAIELKSSGPMAHYYLGLTLVSLKRYEDALPQFEATVANGGDNLALAHKYLGGLYMSLYKDKKKEAADELEKYLKLDPKAPEADRIKGTIKELRSKQ